MGDCTEEKEIRNVLGKWLGKGDKELGVCQLGKLPIRRWTRAWRDYVLADCASVQELVTTVDVFVWGVAVGEWSLGKVRVGQQGEQQKCFYCTWRRNWPVSLQLAINREAKWGAPRPPPTNASATRKTCPHLCERRPNAPLSSPKTMCQCSAQVFQIAWPDWPVHTERPCHWLSIVVFLNGLPWDSQLDTMGQSHGPSGTDLHVSVGQLSDSKVVNSQWKFHCSL